MKHLKTYEFKKEPKIGDYVIVYEKRGEIEVNDFYKNNIGRIVNLNNNEYSDVAAYFDLDKEWDYWIKFDIPKSLFGEVNHLKVEDYSNYFIKGVRPFDRKEIIYYSPNKEDLEVYIDANKYNL